MNQNKPKWIKMDQYWISPRWIKMDQDESRWIKVDQIGSKWINIGFLIIPESV